MSARFDGRRPVVGETWRGRLSGTPREVTAVNDERVVYRILPAGDEYETSMFSFTASSVPPEVEKP